MTFEAILCQFCEVHGPTVVLSTCILSSSHFSAASHVPEAASKLAEDASRSCQTCGTFSSTNPVLISHNQDYDVTLVSGRNSNHNTMLAKHVCVRGLSCESGSPNEDCTLTSTFVLADNLLAGGAVVATFSLYDPFARGFKRSYCAALVSTSGEKTGMISSASEAVIIPSFRHLAGHLQNSNPDQEVQQKSCGFSPQNLAWIHSRFARLLLQVSFAETEVLRLMVTQWTKDEGGLLNDAWPLKAILPWTKTEESIETLDRWISGKGGMVFQGPSKSSVEALAAAFYVLLPPINVKMEPILEDDIWRINTKQETTNSTIVKIMPDFNIQLELTDFNKDKEKRPKMVHDYVAALTKTNTSTSELAVVASITVIRDRYFSLAKLWKHLLEKRCDKEFLVTRGLAECDRSVLNYWSTFINS